MCTYNIARSKTAEDLFLNSDKYEAQSAGMVILEDRSSQLINQDLIRWSDAIYLMEVRHFEYLLKHYYEDIKAKELYILSIPDEFNRGDPELISCLRFILVQLCRLSLS